MLVLGRVFDRFEWVSALTKSHYDVVLVDVNTVGLIVATEQIRELEQSPRNIVSGVHTPTVGLYFAQHGAQGAEPATVAYDGIDDYLAPLTEGVVLAKVREWTVCARNAPLPMVNFDRLYQCTGDHAIMWAMVNEFVRVGASQIFARISPLLRAQCSRARVSLCSQEPWRSNRCARPSQTATVAKMCSQGARAFVTKRTALGVCGLCEPSGSSRSYFASSVGMTDS